MESLPAINGPLDSGFGAAIAFEAGVLAVGEPLFGGTGAVYTSIFAGPGNWELLPALLGEEAGDGFGTAVDVAGEQMVIGSPSRPIVNTATPAGAVYVFRYNSAARVWDLIGPVLRSSEDILAANGEFGAAVSLSRSALPRVVIGAPKNNAALETLETGRVYTFEGNGSAWNALEPAPLVGRSAFDRFGASVAVTSDGVFFISGAPGNGTNSAGYVQIYEWFETRWNLGFEVQGSPGEAFGSSVVSLSGFSIFAVGGPGFEQGSGRVVVYQWQGRNHYSQLGQAIVGSQGDRLGSLGTVCGGENGANAALLLVLGTASGDVISYIFDSPTRLWTQRLPTISTSSASGVTIDYSVVDGLVTGDANIVQVNMYKTLSSSGNEATVPLTQAPVASETHSPTETEIVVLAKDNDKDISIDFPIPEPVVAPPLCAPVRTYF